MLLLFHTKTKLRHQFGTTGGFKLVSVYCTVHKCGANPNMSPLQGSSLSKHAVWTGKKLWPWTSWFHLAEIQWKCSSIAASVWLMLLCLHVACLQQVLKKGLFLLAAWKPTVRFCVFLMMVIIMMIGDWWLIWWCSSLDDDCKQRWCSSVDDALDDDCKQRWCSSVDDECVRKGGGVGGGGVGGY